MTVPIFQIPKTEISSFDEYEGANSIFNLKLSFQNDKNSNTECTR